MGRTSLFDFDRSRGTIVAGADEAGRGCLAGPIVAAGVKLDYNRLSDADLEALSGVNDSKKLSAARREELFIEVSRAASAVAVIVRLTSTRTACIARICIASERRFRVSQPLTPS
jgi:ribonuclease HII